MTEPESPVEQSPDDLVAPVFPVDRVADDEATAMFHRLMPFTATLGIEVLRSDADEIQARMRWAASLCTVGGVLHGGALMSLADATGAACAVANLPEGAKGTTTIESKTNFLRGVNGGAVTAVSRPLHVGRRTIVVETEVRDERTRLIAKVSQTQAVL